MRRGVLARICCTCGPPVVVVWRLSNLTLHKSHNASDEYPTMQHFVQRGALWDFIKVLSVDKVLFKRWMRTWFLGVSGLPTDFYVESINSEPISTLCIPATRLLGSTCQSLGCIYLGAFVYWVLHSVDTNKLLCCGMMCGKSTYV